MTNHIDDVMAGIVLDVYIWCFEENEVDLYVHWSNGETFWCGGAEVKLAEY